MKTYKFIIFLLLVCGCCIHYNSNTKEINQFSIIPISVEEYNTFHKNKERNLLDTNKIKKINGKIKIVGIDSTLSLKDDSMSEEFHINYEYLGYYEIINRHLVQTVYSEGLKFSLIDAKIKIIEIWNIPIFSEDNKYFACIKPYGIEGEEIGFQIWKIQNNLDDNSRTNIKIDKIIELSQMQFSPVECFWRDEFLYVKGESLEIQFYDNPTKTVEQYWKLQFN